MTRSLQTTLSMTSLGALGAVLAAGAALRGVPAPVQSNTTPVTVTRPSALPCPAGTTARPDACVRTVVIPAPAPRSAPGAGGVAAGPQQQRPAAPAAPAGEPVDASWAEGESESESDG